MLNQLLLLKMKSEFVSVNFSNDYYLVYIITFSSRCGRNTLKIVSLPCYSSSVYNYDDVSHFQSDFSHSWLEAYRCQVLWNIRVGFDTMASFVNYLVILLSSKLTCSSLRRCLVRISLKSLNASVFLNVFLNKF